MELQLLLDIIQKNKRGKLLTFIAIDGCGGVGKTTLATKIQKHLKDVFIIHMDNFDLPFNKRLKINPNKKPVGADTDWKRLVREVITPLKKGETATFQKYNWDKDTIDSEESINPEGIIIIEGVYAMRNELSQFYNLKIWIDCPLQIRLERGIARDGEKSRERWITDWLPMEKRYIKLHKPHKRADILLRT